MRAQEHPIPQGYGAGKGISAQEKAKIHGFKVFTCALVLACKLKYNALVHACIFPTL